MKNFKHITITILVVFLMHSSIIARLSSAIPHSIRAENATEKTNQKSLNGTSWVLVSWTDKILLNSSGEEIQVTVNFIDNQVNGTATCNRYTASYQIENNQLKISPPLTTRKTCMGEVMRLESQYLEALEGAKSYEINSQGQLKVSYEAAQDSGVMIFSPQEQTSLENTDWIFLAFEETTGSTPPFQGTQITANFTKNQLSGNSGCNQYMTSYRREGNKVFINPFATTRKACPPEIMKQEFQYLTALEGAQWYEINPQGQLQIYYRTNQGSGSIIFQDDR